MRAELNAEESLAAFNYQKDLLYKQVKRKLGHKFKGIQNRVRVRNDLDKVFHRWTRKKPLVRYYTQRCDVDNFRDVTNEGSPYALPASSWYRVKEGKKEEPLDPSLKHYQLPTQRGKDTEDILKRVFIPPYTKPLPLGVCDFNPDYFSLVKGRETEQMSSKTKYRDSIKSTMLYNLMAYVYKDKTKFVNQQFLMNFKLISELYDSLYEAEEILKSFSYYDEIETLKVKNTQKMFWRMYTENIEIIESVKRRTSSILNDVQYTWDRLLTRLHCKKLLYEISPPSWKKWYDQKKQAWKPEDLESYNTLNRHYERYVRTVGIQDPEIAKIMEECRGIYATLGPNYIYYSHMSQVEEVFKDLEGQATLALEYNAVISNHKEKLLKLLEETERYYSHEKNILEDLIEVLGKKIQDSNNRANYLEERLNSKADTWFKETVVGEETLMVKTLVQCLYDEIVGQRNRIMSNREMMEFLEAKMIKLRTDIGQIDKEERSIMSHRLKKREEEALVKAEQAKLREQSLKKLIKQMEVSMRELPPKSWRDPKPRSIPSEQVTKATYRRIKKPIQRHSIKDHIVQDDEFDCITYDSLPHVQRGAERVSTRFTDLIDL